MPNSQKVDRRNFFGDKTITGSDAIDPVLETPIPFPTQPEKVVQKQEKQKVDLKTQPIQKEALRLYNNATLLFGEKEGQGHPAPRKFLLFSSLGYLALALGRQITAEDLKILLKDEGIKKCFVEKTKVRAISWTVLGEKIIQRVEREVQKGATLEEMFQNGTLFHVGGFYIPEGSRRFYFVSGTPYPDNRKKGDFSYLKYGMHKQILPGFGDTSEVAIRIVNRNKKENISQFQEREIQKTLSEIGKLKKAKR